MAFRQIWAQTVAVIMGCRVDTGREWTTPASVDPLVAYAAARAPIKTGKDFAEKPNIQIFLSFEF